MPTFPESICVCSPSFWAQSRISFQLAIMRPVSISSNRGLFLSRGLTLLHLLTPHQCPFFQKQLASLPFSSFSFFQPGTYSYIYYIGRSVFWAPLLVLWGWPVAQVVCHVVGTFRAESSRVRCKALIGPPHKAKAKPCKCVSHPG